MVNEIIQIVPIGTVFKTTVSEIAGESAEGPTLNNIPIKQAIMEG